MANEGDGQGFENEPGDEWGEAPDAGQNAGNDIRTQIENMFVEAECKGARANWVVVMETKPDDALVQFQTVYELETQQQEECN
jgi:hypothetical protein